MKRAAFILAMAPVLASPVGVAFADTTPPPPASATGSALDIAGVLGIGQTSAEAGPTSSSATASAISLGGATLQDGTTGGSAKTGENKTGNIFDSGATPLGSLAIAPWSAQAASGSASSKAALARITVVDANTVAINVLQSQSDAKYDATGSHGSASSDGATVMLGGGALFLDVLHSEASSGQGGSSYLVGINGQQIGSSDQAAGACVIDASPLLKLICLTANGGKGGTTADAAVAQVDLGGGALTGTVVGSTSKGAPAAAAPTVSKPTGTTKKPTGTGVLGERTPARSTGNLPFTGLPTNLLLSIGAALLGLGTALTRARRAGTAA